MMNLWFVFAGTYVVCMCLLILLIVIDDEVVRKVADRYRLVYYVHITLVYFLSLIVLSPIQFIVEGAKGVSTHVKEFTHLYTQALKDKK